MKQNNTVRFLHTADWHLGKRPHYLNDEKQGVFAQSRFDAIRKLGEIARDKKCDFILVCGDVFDKLKIDKGTIAKTIETLKNVHVPVYLMPGNHDPLNVFQESKFCGQKPDHVHVCETGELINVGENIELLAPAWLCKKMDENPLVTAINALSPKSEGTIRIGAGHGGVDSFPLEDDDDTIFPVKFLENAILDNKLDYIALGHRHSVTKINNNDRIWYSGPPESTDFRDSVSGYALIVEIDGEKVNIEKIEIGNWRFIEIQKKFGFDVASDIESFRQELNAKPNKEKTVLFVEFSGAISVAECAILEEIIEDAKHLFAHIDSNEIRNLVQLTDADFSDFGFSGFANNTVNRLQEFIAHKSQNAGVAQDALILLRQIAKGGK